MYSDTDQIAYGSNIQGIISLIISLSWQQQVLSRISQLFWWKGPTTGNGM